MLSVGQNKQYRTHEVNLKEFPSTGFSFLCGFFFFFFSLHLTTDRLSTLPAAFLTSFLILKKCSVLLYSTLLCFYAGWKLEKTAHCCFQRYRLENFYSPLPESFQGWTITKSKLSSWGTLRFVPILDFSSKPHCTPRQIATEQSTTVPAWLQALAGAYSMSSLHPSCFTLLSCRAVMATARRGCMQLFPLLTGRHWEHQTVPQLLAALSGSLANMCLSCKHAAFLFHIATPSPSPWCVISEKHLQHLVWQSRLSATCAVFFSMFLADRSSSCPVRSMAGAFGQ